VTFIERRSKLGGVFHCRNPLYGWGKTVKRGEEKIWGQAGELERGPLEKRVGEGGSVKEIFVWGLVSEHCLEGGRP